jgi:hypothetical protein
MSYTLGDIVAGIPAKSAGRNNWGTTADGSLGIVAAMQAVMEITETAELEELKYQTPIPPLTPLILGAGNPIVPIATVLGTIATNTAYPQFQSIAADIVDVTDQYDSWIWFSSGGFQPGAVNQSGRILKYRRIPAVDMYTFGVTSSNQTSYGVAPPVYYSRFNQNFMVGPSPDNSYSYFFRVKLRHPWPSSNFASATIFAPDSWQQVFQYAAVCQLAKDEGIQDSSIYKTAMNFLTSRGMDSMTLRRLQMQRDELHNERSLSLKVNRYTWA